jgi:hypothetical protein
MTSGPSAWLMRSPSIRRPAEARSTLKWRLASVIPGNRRRPNTPGPGLEPSSSNGLASEAALSNEEGHPHGTQQLGIPVVGPAAFLDQPMPQRAVHGCCE